MTNCDTLWRQAPHSDHPKAMKSGLPLSEARTGSVEGLSIPWCQPQMWRVICPASLCVCVLLWAWRLPARNPPRQSECALQHEHYLR